MAKVSAGLLLCRQRNEGMQFLLAHPGGPFFARKDDGAWTIPKGLVDPDEQPIDAARREFAEETGFSAPADGLLSLGEIRQKGGKRVHAWAFVGDCDPETVRSNTFELEWPRGSGHMQRFPEIDRVAWFDADTARRKILTAQVPFIDRAIAAVAGEDVG